MGILVTGGAGYIGSHTIVALHAQGLDVVSMDNHVNSMPAVYDRIERISGRRPATIEADVSDRSALDRAFTEHEIDAVIHFAGLKSLAESVEEPLRYWRTNLNATFSLVEAAEEHGVHTLVFSSSATVYGSEAPVPYEESWPHLKATNPYGQTKAVLERFLSDVAAANPDWRIALLRYFNPVGAHESGLIGEHPVGVPNNLTPYITQVAIGNLEQLRIFGDDYDTVDGTAERDYLHVEDLADGHVAALRALASRAPGVRAWNLGTGAPVSVLEVVDAFESAIGRSIPKAIAPRRSGDLPVVYANTARAADELGWVARRTIHDAAADAWRWQERNPRGYAE